jgi:hypothetical protein
LIAGVQWRVDATQHRTVSTTGIELAVDPIGGTHIDTGPFRCGGARKIECGAAPIHKEDQATQGSHGS